MRKSRMEDKGVWYLLPGLCGLMLFYVLPFFQSISYVVTKGVSERQFVGLDNFKDLYANPVFIMAVKNTFLFLILAVPSLLFLSLLLSFHMLRGKWTIVRIALLIPMVVPETTLVLGIGQIFEKNGMINRILLAFGGGMVPFLESHAMGITVLVYVIKNIGYMVVLLNGAMSALPREYEDAYRMDGKAGVGYLFRIVLVSVLPMFFFVVLLAVTNSFRIYRYTYLLYGNNPPQEAYLLQNFMNNNFYKLNYQRLSAAAFTIVFFLCIWIIAFLHYQKKTNARSR